MEGRECVEKPIESQHNHDAENGKNEILFLQKEKERDWMKC